MGAEEIVLIGAAGGAVLLATQKPAAPKPTGKAPNGGTPIQGPGSGTPGSSVKPFNRTGMVIGGKRSMVRTYASRSLDQPNVVTVTQSSNSATPNGDAQLNAKLTEIEQAASQAYDKLGDDAKQAGAAAVNSALGTNLTGDEDWHTVETVVGGAVGGAVGGYIGGPIGAKLGAICGAYLGVQLGDLLSKNWDDLKNWLDSTWNDVEQYVSDKANDLEDQAEGYVNDATDWVGGLV